MKPKYYIIALALLLAAGIVMQRRHALPSLDRSDDRPAPEALSSTDHSPGHSGNAHLLTVDPVWSRISTALESFSTDADDVRRSESIRQLAGTIADADLSQVLTALQTSTNGPGAELRRYLLNRWASSNPAAAAAWAQALAPGAVRTESLSQCAIVWANSDLAEAIAWAKQLPEGSEREKSLIGIGYEAARNQPLQAMQIEVELPPSRERDELLLYTVRQWAAVDAPGAVEWAQQIAQPELRDQMLSKISAEWAEKDAAAAATYAMNTLPAGDLQERTAVEILERWAQQSPEAAAKWVEQFPESPVREDSVQNLISLWASQEISAPGQWLSQLPPGSLYDSGVAAYATVLAVAYPKQATEWMNTISDKTRQADCRQALARLCLDKAQSAGVIPGVAHATE